MLPYEATILHAAARRPMSPCDQRTADQSTPRFVPGLAASDEQLSVYVTAG
jgi:hypothetical protein